VWFGVLQCVVMCCSLLQSLYALETNFRNLHPTPEFAKRTCQNMPNLQRSTRQIEPTTRKNLQQARTYNNRQPTARKNLQQGSQATFLCNKPLHHQQFDFLTHLKQICKKRFFPLFCLKSSCAIVPGGVRAKQSK